MFVGFATARAGSPAPDPDLPATPSDRPTHTLPCARPTPQHPRSRSKLPGLPAYRDARTDVLHADIVAMFYRDICLGGTRLWYAVATHHTGRYQARDRPPCRAPIIQLCLAGKIERHEPTPVADVHPNQHSHSHRASRRSARLIRLLNRSTVSGRSNRPDPLALAGCPVACPQQQSK